MARVAKHSTVSAGSGTELTVISPPKGRETMPTFAVTVLETRINEYRIAAENADEARAAIKKGNDKVVIRQYLLEPNVLRVLPESLAPVRGERSFTVGAREEQVIDLIYWVEAKSAQEARAMVERADPSLTRSPPGRRGCPGPHPRRALDR